MYTMPIYEETLNESEILEEIMLLEMEMALASEY